MRITIPHVLTLASAALLSNVAAGQSATAPQSSAQTELKSGEVRASHLLEATVKRMTGDTVGEVQDVIVSGDDVRLVVISVGGVLGVGGKTIALPMDQFQVAPDGATLYLNLSQQELEARPAFDLEKIADDAWQASNDPEAAAAAAPTPQTLSDTSRSGFIPSASPAAPDESVVHESAVEPEPRVPAQPEPVSPQAQPEPVAAQAQAQAETRAKAANQPARALIGAEVVDADYSAVGKVNDVVVTAEPAEVKVIVELSEVPGSAGKLVAVPLPELTISQSGPADTARAINRVETELTIAQLEALPQFQY